jgi:hypothetical protein
MGDIGGSEIETRPGEQVEPPERKDNDEGGSLLGEVSVATLIVSVVVVVAIAGYALLLIVELFR